MGGGIQMKWTAFLSACALSFNLVACGGEDTEDEGYEDAHEVSHVAHRPLGLSVKEQEKGRPLWLRRAVLEGEKNIPHTVSPDPRIMYVSTFGTADSTGKEGEQPAAEDEDGDRATADELDPSGIFEVRETGFLPAPDLMVEQEAGRAITLKWDPVSGADGYRVTVVRFGSDGLAIDHFQQDVRGVEVVVNTGGLRITASVRAYAWEPMRRSGPSNKITFDPSDP